ncbi:MAG: hypothetical protein AABW51_01310 [Nanoarchaeota archaeon]
MMEGIDGPNFGLMGFPVFEHGKFFGDNMPHTSRDLHPTDVLEEPQMVTRHAKCRHYFPIDRVSGTCTIAKEDEISDQTKTHCDNYANCDVYISVKRRLA